MRATSTAGSGAGAGPVRAVADGPDPDEVETIDADVLQAAELAGLRYVADVEPGIRRRRRGRGFSYVSDTGAAVAPAHRARIDALAIPPAWTDVWICRDGRGHLQATGRDARGRKQYRYHARWSEVRDSAKFDRLADFGTTLPDLRARIAEDLGLPGMPHAKVVALVVALLDRTLIRVGNDQYRRQNGSYGLTTLEADHVDVTGATVEFSFVGKGGREHSTRLRDRRLARAVRSCHELGGRELFTYLGEQGTPVRFDSSDCNDYLADVVGAGTTVKYFRTWGASATALEALVDAGADPDDADVLAAVDRAAERLGNTRAVCRRAYVHPVLTDQLDAERVQSAWARARTTPSMSRAERALLHLLRDQDPNR